MSSAKVRAIVLALCAGSTSRLLAQPFPAPVASYQITCRLDAEKKTIEATEVLTWKNTTSRPAPTLRFHLYLNAFRNTLSTFWRESGGEGRDGKLPDSWGSTEITRMIGPDGADLLPAMRFIAPDDGNPHDRTVSEVILPKPVQPGETISVSLDFTARLPRVSVRTGYKDEFFMVVQWFPKIGVLEEKGWNCHQFHATSEFFSDFGNYDVSIDVPARYKGKVGATGERVDERETSAGRVLYRFRQQGVHDFAWTADPSYLVLEDTFREAGLGDVRLHLYLQPEHARQAERYFGAARAALSGYGRVLGPYPYPTLSIVDPPWGARGAGGMEYPTLITAGTRWLAAHSDDPEDVVVHETGHQFFYGIVGSNEFEDAWMDEGINTFAEARVMGSLEAFYYTQRYFGGFVPFAFKDIRLDRESSWNRFAGYRRNPKLDRQSTPSYQYYPSANVTTYNKTALWLNTMERWLGWPTVQRTLSTLFTRWQFKHPKPQDFFAIANEAAGRDLTPFFDQVYRSSDTFDYGIQELRSDRENGRYRTTLVVRRYGEAVFPIDVRITFDNGEQVTEHWDGRDRWRQYLYYRDAKARSAEADPDRVLLLDVNVTNNSRTLEPKGLRAATKWSLKWMVWLQDCLLSWSVFI